MTRLYHISGMNCGGCAAKLQSALSGHLNVEGVEVDKATDTARITSRQEVSIGVIRDVIKGVDAKYDVSPIDVIDTLASDDRSWLSTYRPILLIFAFLTGITVLVEYQHDGFDMMRWMRHFMAGFFLTFAFFKLLDVKGFANSYRTYDIVADKWPVWGYIYPFVELGLGIAYLMNYEMLAVNIAAFLIMTVSIIGVLRSVLNKRKIQCACLGAVFDLPMSTVTIIEDALMIVMSGWMILTYLN